MNYKHLKDQQLHMNLISAIKDEKLLLTRILHLLKEVDARKLFSDFQCASLFEYATKILNYSEAEAYTRINAMRLIREIPQVEIDMEIGTLSLTNIAQAQNFFRKEEKERKKTKKHNKKNIKLSRGEKVEILQKIKNCSTRKAKKILLTISPTPYIHKESVKSVSHSRTEIRFSIDDKTHKKLDKLKALLAHEDGLMSLENLFEKLCDKVLEQIQNQSISKARHNNLTLTKNMKKLIKKRDGHRCKNCGSQFDLQIDHVIPKGFGGINHPNNLQTLCRQCNLRRAVKFYGAEKIQRFI